MWVRVRARVRLCGRVRATGRFRVRRRVIRSMGSVWGRVRVRG